MLTALGLISACGGGGTDGSSGSNLAGNVANAPIVGAAVTVTDINGNVVATGTTGADGRYTLAGSISVSPFIVTVSSTPTSRFGSGADTQPLFKGELKGLFASGASATSLMVTIPSSILYKIWDSMGRPTDITAAQDRAVAMLQLLGIDPTLGDSGTVDDLWTTNPVGVDFEIINQQLVFLCGQEDASGAADILTRASNLAESYMSGTNPVDQSAGGMAALIEQYTGYTVDFDAGGTYANFADLLNDDDVKNVIASAVKAGLENSPTASSQVSSIDTVLSRVNTLNTNYATQGFGTTPGYITLAASGAGKITNTNTTQPIVYGSGTTDYAVTISGRKANGTAPTAGAFSIYSVTSGLTHNAAATFNSGTTVTFTVPTGTQGTYAVTVRYTENSKNLDTTFYFKVLNPGAYSAAGADFNAGPEALVFTSTNKTLVPAGTEFTVTGGASTQGKYTPSTSGKNYIGSFYLPDGMYFVDGNNLWQNWDVVDASSGTAEETINLTGTPTVRVNKDLSFGEYTWTFRVFDENRDQLLTSGSEAGFVYTTGGATVVRQIVGDKYNNGSANKSTHTYGPSGDSPDINFAGGTTGNQYINLTGTFSGGVQTWAMAAGTDNHASLNTDDFYINVQSSNYDDYTKSYGLGDTPTQNLDVDVTWDVGTGFVTTNDANYYPFSVSVATTKFYPDYADGQTNIDKIRFGYEYTTGTKSKNYDTLSRGTTFSKE